MVEPWVRDIVEEAYGALARRKIGDRVLIDGRLAQITSGCFFDPVYGRVSNFWYWRYLNADGSLSDEEGHGYGEDWPLLPEI